MKRLLLLPAVLLAACASHPQQRPAPAPTAALAEPPLPKSPDVHDQVMGWLVISDGAHVLRELQPPGQPNASPQALEAELAQAIGMDPRLAQIIDLRRPLGVALLNPTLLASSTVRPYVAMVPVSSRADVERFFRERNVQFQPTAWGLILPGDGQKLYVAFRRGYALMAWRADLLEAAEQVLAPKLAAHAEAPILLHVSMDNVEQAYGPSVERLVARFAQAAASGGAEHDPQVAFGMRGIERLTHLVPSVQAAELLADLDSGGLTLTVRVDGKDQGAFTQFVAEQRSGPSWGTEFLPGDSVMVFTTHRSVGGRDADVESLVTFLNDAVPNKPADEAEAERWRNALYRAERATEGDLAWAIWPGRAGGVGIGGAYRLSEPAMAPAALRDAYDPIGDRVGVLVARSLGLDTSRFGDRFVTRHRTAQVGGVEVDVLEVSVRWPANARAERRTFEAMFGPKLTMGTAFVGDRALFAIGADWQPRLATMISAAHGERAASVGDQPGFAEALAWKPGARVSFSALDTSRMIHLAAALLQESRELTPAEQAAVKELLARSTAGEIVAVTRAGGRRFELSTHVPGSAIHSAAQLSGALWRVALSPILNPPVIPPLPLPPPHVTPTMGPSGGASSGAGLAPSL